MEGMKNVIVSIEGDDLVLRINTKQDFGLSKSGKTHTVAQSGFAKVEAPELPGLGFHLNVWKGIPGK